MNLKKKQDLFMASISHELRTPLTSILGYGDLLNNTHLGSKQQEYLKRMLHSSKYLLSLVGDFLDIVKFQNDEIDLDLKEIRLHTVLSECAEIIKANLHENVKFETNIPFLTYTILADDRRIKQVMLNLLSNAAKFTKYGTIKFYIKNVTEYDDQIKITVNIEDSGIGMSKEVQKALFSPFVTNDSTQGFGLGLYISQEIIRLMGGEIKVTSQEGEGSTFSVTFLAKKSKNKDINQILSGKNILILSDDIEFNQTFSDTLNNFNSTLHSYSPSKDMPSTFRNIFASTIEYHIVIFDMNYIDFDIINLISTLRVLHPNIKCVALIDNNNDIKISIFDKVIQTPIEVQNFICELEELSVIHHKHKKNNQFIDFSHLNVLVVEDVEMSRHYIKEMFSVSFSIQCDTAINGRDAVEKVTNNTYDIIFMDIRMPVLNGLDATKEIRTFNPSIPIICMSADVHEEDKQAAKDIGMNSFIQKPLDKSEIIESLLKLIPQGTTCNIHNYKNLKNDKVSNKSTQLISLKDIAYNHLSENFDRETIHLLFSKSIKSIELHLNNVKSHLKNRDYQGLVEDFHAFRGLLGNLGLEHEVKTASKLQIHFKKNDFNQAVVTKVLLFTDKIRTFLKDIEVELSNQ
ncbi:MAG: response regulator [Campylobacterota bacterium]|nr:response regulator [Campylobacterota bacterium]